MPKKGLIAIPGMISASGSDGLGLMQMPPVSENTGHIKTDYKDGLYSMTINRSDTKPNPTM